MIKIPVIATAIMLATTYLANAQDLSATNLRTNLIQETDVIFENGFRSESDISTYNPDNKNFQIVKIRTRKPKFSWAISSETNNTKQESYRIIVSSSKSRIDAGYGDMWDSQTISSNVSSGISYNGKELEPNKLYYWKVKANDNEFSEAKAFYTGDCFDESVSFLPLEKHIEHPQKTYKTGNGIFADFGKDAFGQIALNLSEPESNTITIRLGEVADGKTVNTTPGGTRRYKQLTTPAVTSQSYYQPDIPKDNQNTNINSNGSGVTPILMPSYIGEVMPFRYCEILNTSGNINAENIERLTVNYPFDDDESYFESSDTVLNQVYELCKHSMKATSFCGKFVDGDRERIPYEADIFINMLTYFAVSSNYSISRRSIEHIIFYPTWPTEWILYTNMLVYYDYLYTGDNSLIADFYEELKNKTLNYIRNNENNLLYTGSKITDDSKLRLIHFKGTEVRDIVDWPHHSSTDPGEDDNFDYKECNTVVNIMYFKALQTISELAKAIDKEEDSEMFASLADETKKSILKNLVKNGVLIDGLNSSHSSLHSQMFGLAMGIIDKNYDRMASLIKDKGMVCSVYGAQIFLDAVYTAGMSEYGLNVLTSTQLRSFYNMIKSGSTITTEAWDNSLKANQDWNHAWGSAAGNVIVRKLMGIEPTEPGFAKFSVKPQPGSLKSAKIKVPTIKGPIEMSFTNDGTFKMKINVPPNTEAYVTLPNSKKEIILGSGTYNL